MCFVYIQNKRGAENVTKIPAHICHQALYAVKLWSYGSNSGRGVLLMPAFSPKKKEAEEFLVDVDGHEDGGKSVTVVCAGKGRMKKYRRAEFFIIAQPFYSW